MKEKSPIIDSDISAFLQRDDLHFKATLDPVEAFTMQISSLFQRRLIMIRRRIFLIRLL